MKKIKVNKANIPTVCDHIRRMVLSAGNVNFFAKSGTMSVKQIKAAMMPGSHFPKSVADAEGYLSVDIAHNIFREDAPEICVSKNFGSKFRCSGAIAACIIPGDCLIINCFGIAIIRENYRQFVSFVKA